MSQPRNVQPAEMQYWVDRYMTFTIRGVRSEGVSQKIALHLQRFRAYFATAYGHDRLADCVPRDVVAWQRQLVADGLAPATVNNHLASLSSFTTWVCVQAPRLFACGDPTKGIGELALPPLEPRSLTEAQVRSLKSLCDRLPRYHLRHDRRLHTDKTEPVQRQRGRPWRDRAIVFVLLSTGLRREELVRLNLNQISPDTSEGLRNGRRGRINRVLGKGKTERTVFLSVDARGAVADYLDKERQLDVGTPNEALFLSANGIPQRAADGRLSPRAINLILEQIGRWHDADSRDVERNVSPLRPHDLRHTFAFMLARITGADAYELERRLGHRSQRYIQRYTNPPEQVAAQYIEEF